MILSAFYLGLHGLHTLVERRKQDLDRQKEQEEEALRASEAKLQDEISDLRNQLSAFEQQQQHQQEKETLANHRQFGPSSDIPQEAPFNELESDATPVDVPSSKGKKKKKRRKPVTKAEAHAHLPVETLWYDIPEEERRCTSCGSGSLKPLPHETAEELEVIPEQVVRQRRYRQVYTCPSCERRGTSTMIRAAIPERPVPKGNLSASTIAWSITQKFQMAIPLYRQAQSMSARGVKLERQTLANNLAAVGDQWIRPMVDLLQAHLLEQDVLHADETRIQVLREEDRKPTSHSYMWAYASAVEEVPCVVFDYHASRGHEAPLAFLEGFEGTLFADAHGAYRKVAEKQPGISLAGCWAHARRKFVEATHGHSGSGISHDGVAWIGKIYDLHHAYRTASEGETAPAEEALQQALDDFFHWVEEHERKAMKKSGLGRALGYARKQEPYLRAAIEAPTAVIDNNPVERAIRPFAVGRKNWLFANAPRGADVSALLYSLVHTAQANRLNIHAYLRYLLETLPNLPSLEPDVLKEYLPWAPAMQEAFVFKPE